MIKFQIEQINVGSLKGTVFWPSFNLIVNGCGGLGSDSRAKSNTSTATEIHQKGGILFEKQHSVLVKNIVISETTAATDLFTIVQFALNLGRRMISISPRQTRKC